MSSEPIITIYNLPDDLGKLNNDTDAKKAYSIEEFNAKVIKEIFGEAKIILQKRQYDTFETTSVNDDVVNEIASTQEYQDWCQDWFETHSEYDAYLTDVKNGASRSAAYKAEHQANAKKSRAAKAKAEAEAEAIRAAKAETDAETKAAAAAAAAAAADAKHTAEAKAQAKYEDEAKAEAKIITQFTVCLYQYQQNKTPNQKNMPIPKLFDKVTLPNHIIFKEIDPNNTAGGGAKRRAKKSRKQKRRVRKSRRHRRR